MGEAGVEDRLQMQAEEALAVELEEYNQEYLLTQPIITALEVLLVSIPIFTLTFYLFLYKWFLFIHIFIVRCLCFIILIQFRDLMFCYVERII